MNSPFGLYRAAYGSAPVEATYEYETGKIGPYKIPIFVDGVASSNSVNLIPLPEFYRAFQQYREAVAVFNLNNNTIGVICANEFFQLGYNGEHYFDKIDSYQLDPPVSVPKVRHIGYVRTFAQCKSIFEKPYYLLQSYAGNVVGFYGYELEGEPVESPPVSLYVELLKNPKAKAVYQLKDTGEIKFIEEEP